MFDDIYNQVKELDISLLINNAGVAEMIKFEEITYDMISE